MIMNYSKYLKESLDDTFKLFERLGYNEEVSQLAEYIWKLYKQGERVIDLNEYSKKNMSISINKLFIDEYSNRNIGRKMTAWFNTSKYYKTKNIEISVNKFHRPTLMSFEHEIKHIYDFIKSGGFLKMKDKIKLSPFSEISSSDENVDILFYIMYIIEMNEIEAYYHSDIRNFKENKHKFNNDIKKYLKYSRLQSNLNYLNDNDIKDIVDEISKDDKNVILKLYYLLQKYYKINQDKILNTTSKIKILGIKFRKFLDDHDINIKHFTEQEVDNFYKSLEKEVERKKKIYRRYIERLYSYFS